MTLSNGPHSHANSSCKLLGIFPSDVWFNIMLCSGYRTNKIMQMCCMDFKRLVELPKLDDKMFRKPASSVPVADWNLDSDLDKENEWQRIHEGFNSEDGKRDVIEYHPILEHLWWAGCACMSDIVVLNARSYFEKNKSCLPVCMRLARSEYIKEGGEDDHDADTVKTLPPHVRIPEILATCKEFLTRPARKQMKLATKGRDCINISNPTGLTVSDLVANLLQQAAWRCDFRIYVLQDYEGLRAEKYLLPAFEQHWADIVFGSSVQPESWQQIGAVSRFYLFHHENDKRASYRKIFYEERDLNPFYFTPFQEAINDRIPKLAGWLKKVGAAIERLEISAIGRVLSNDERDMYSIYNNDTLPKFWDKSESPGSASDSDFETELHSATASRSPADSSESSGSELFSPASLADTTDISDVDVSETAL